MNAVYDVIIIGAGPAGITASVYAARKRMKACVITLDIGGQAAWSGDIENYTGYQFISGPELAAKFEEHLRKYEVLLKEGERVTGIKEVPQAIEVTTDKGSYQSRTVIIASGKRSRELRVPGEKEFKNRGLTYCATCDGPLFSGKTVAVVGGGNSALDAVLQLVRIAQKVYVINSTSQLGGDPVMRENVQADSRVTIFNSAQVSEVLGDKMVRGIKILRNSGTEELPVEGVFVEIGLLPNSEFAPGIQKNEHGEIKVDCSNRTNIPGIFAAGDVTDVSEKQIIIAAGEGAKAALAAFRFLVSQRP